MLKTNLSYLFIFLGLFILWLSTSRSAMKFISEHRDNNEWYGSYQGLHGDLVSLCYLDMVQRFNPPPEKVNYKKPASSFTRNTILYLHGDSYTYRIPDSVFSGLYKLYLIDRNHGLNYHLDSTKKNILLIEVSERYLRAYFSGLQILDEVCDSIVRKKNLAVEKAAGSNRIDRKSVV